ncbi:MAG: hypothetical protein GXY77_07995 [Fibrobacter sp.]|nr:hypothetical protein [Fibrobacter sp.]
MTLPGFQIIEIVLALLTLYIFLCILITAFNEFLDCLLDRRRKYFKKAIDNLLGYGNIDNNENPFFSNDIIKSINKSTGNKYTNIPDGIIADVILNIWYKSNQENRSNTDNLNQIIDIQMVNADKELVKIKKNLKNWLIEFWEPITKYYRIQTSIITFISAFILACVFNLDTIMLVRFMWANRSVSQIEEISAKTVTPDSLFIYKKFESQKDQYWNQVEAISRQHQFRFFPLGWVCNDNDTISCFYNLRASPFRSVPIFINKIIGLVFTALMVSLGANFWFKILEKYIKVK